jgi:tetratricopeptide (TPR) repeat protein
MPAMKPPSPARTPPPVAFLERFIGLLLALVTLMIYLPVRQQGFCVYDDNDYISQNFIVQQGLTWAGVKWAFTTCWASNWHPLTWLSHMSDCQLFGLNAGAHHLINVLWHAGNAVLLFFLARRLTGKNWAAALIAALFAWHPLRVESVAWLAERKDVLSANFELWALWFYVRYAGEKRAGNYYLALFCFALSLLAKPMPITLPCLLLVLDWWPLQRLTAPAARARAWAALAWEKWPFFLLAAASGTVTYFAQRSSAVLSLAHDPLSLRLGNAALAYVKYLLNTAWPVDLAVIYPLPGQLEWPRVAVAVAALAAISCLAWRQRHAQPYLLTGWLWYLGCLVPVIGLVQTGQQAMADRYTYFPGIGICLAAVLGLQALADRFQVKTLPLTLGAAVVLAACLGLTERQLSFWRDDESLFAHALALTGDNFVAQVNLGSVLEQAGRKEEAMAHYKAALLLAPDNVEAHNNLADLLDDAGESSAALEQYRIALSLNPHAFLARCNLGTLLAKLGRWTDALEQYREAVRLQPGNPHVHYLMGKALWRQGQSQAAMGELRQAVNLDPRDFQSRTLLAQILASDENPANRNGSAAVDLAEAANALTGGAQPLVLDALAMAYAEAGRYHEAQATAESALSQAEAAHSPLAATLRQHWQAHQAGRPWRASLTNSAPAN